MHACMLEAPPTQASIQPLAGRWRTVSGSLRSCRLPAPWHHAARTVYSEKSLANERDRQIGSGNWMVIHPYSCFQFHWACFILIINFISLLYIPIQVFLTCPDPYDPFILLCDNIGLMAIIINFLTGYVGKDGKNVILEPRKIAVYYLKDTFIIDVISTLPFQLIKFNIPCQFPTYTILYLLKLPRFVHVVRNFNQVAKQCQLTYAWAIFSSLIISALFFFHWITFIHYQTPLLYAYEYKHEGHYLHWLQRFKVVKGEDETKSPGLLEKYVSNLYFAAGLGVGAGSYSVKGVNVRLVPELIMTMCIGLLGWAYMTFVFTTIIRLLMYGHFQRYIFYGRIKELQKYLENKGIPARLRQKIQLYINYRFNGHYFHEKFIWNTINVQIKQEVNMFCCKKLLLDIPLFQDMPIALINTVIFSLSQLVYMPGEVMVKFGHPGTALYLISSGTVAVMDSQGREIGHLKDGAYFGERALLKPGTPRSATVIALEITEIYKLTYQQFETCLQPCPRLKRRLFEDADHILSRTAMRRAARRLSSASGAN